MTRNDWLEPLLRHDVGVVHETDENTSRPFEGAYGAAYSAMIARRPLRRAFFSMWGDAAPLFQLDRIVADVAASLEPGDPILDVPCGRGIVADLLARSDRPVRLAGLDLARRAIEHATTAARELDPNVDARYVRGSALELPFVDEAFGAIVSINGLHVMPDHQRFLAEIARVLRPGGSAWLITPVSGGGPRGALMLRAGSALGVLSQPPPTAHALEAMTEAAGFTSADRLGGTSIVGLRLQRSHGR